MGPKYQDPPDTENYGQANAPHDSEVEGAYDADPADAAPTGHEEGGGISEGMLPSISLPITVALGRSFMSIKEILKLRPGQILELNKNPNEPVDLVVNGKVVARGELVDVDGRLAVRLIKIVE